MKNEYGEFANYLTFFLQSDSSSLLHYILDNMQVKTC